MKNDPRPIETPRSKALEWWNKLSTEEKNFYCRLVHGNKRPYQSLTGREVEQIYKF